MERLHVQDIGRGFLARRPFSEGVAIVQPKDGECQNPLESEDSSHIARKEFT